MCLDGGALSSCECRRVDSVLTVSNFVEDVFQGFKVLYNMKRKLCGFYIIWKANFVGERWNVTYEVCEMFDTAWNLDSNMAREA